jgi:hypothetical protein
MSPTRTSRGSSRIHAADVARHEREQVLLDRFLLRWPASRIRRAFVPAEVRPFVDQLHTAQADDDDVAHVVAETVVEKWFRTAMWAHLFAPADLLVGIRRLIELNAAKRREIGIDGYQPRTVVYVVPGEHGIERVDP